MGRYGSLNMSLMRAYLRRSPGGFYYSSSGNETTQKSNAKIMS